MELFLFVICLLARRGASGCLVRYRVRSVSAFYCVHKPTPLARVRLVSEESHLYTFCGMYTRTWFHLRNFSSCCIAVVTFNATRLTCLFFSFQDNEVSESLRASIDADIYSYTLPFISVVHCELVNNISYEQFQQSSRTNLTPELLSYEQFASRIPPRTQSIVIVH